MDSAFVLKNKPDSSKKLSRKYYYYLSFLSVLAFFCIIAALPAFYRLESFQGLAYDRSLEKIAISAAVCGLLPFFIQLRSRIITYCAITYYLLNAVPSLSIYSLFQTSEGYLFSSLFPFVALAFLARCHCPIQANFAVPRLRLGLILLLCLLAFSLITFYISFRYSGIMALGLDQSYSLREALQKGGIHSGLIAYFTAWSTNVFLPLVITGIIVTRANLFVKFLLFSGVLTAYIAAFAVTGVRFVLFYPFFVAFLSCIRNSLKRFVIIAPIGLLLFAVIGLMFASTEYENPDLGVFSIPAEAAFRRFLMTPSYVNQLWADYFSSDDTWTFFGDLPLIRNLLPQKYEISTSAFLARHVYKWTWGSLSTGPSGTGFASLGLLGSVIYSSLTSAVIWIWSQMLHSKGISPGFIFSFSFISIDFLLRNSDLFSALLTHGVILLFLCSFFVCPDSRKI
jgi:hypothetical protein